jgi:hypothetical protein
MIVMAENIHFIRLVDHEVTDDDHYTKLLFLECGIAKLNPQQNSQHEYLNSHKFKTSYFLLFTSSSPMEER